jgi:archaellum biogenesis ATPase FlaH
MAILLKGDPHAGKSEFLKQLIDGFLEMNWTCALFDLEQGGMASKDTEASIRRNIKKKNLSRLL